MVTDPLEIQVWRKGACFALILVAMGQDVQCTQSRVKVKMLPVARLSVAVTE